MQKFIGRSTSEYELMKGIRKLLGSSFGEDATSLAPPKHIAIIMDGNGRWAKKRFLPRSEGHRAGGKTVRMVVEECRRLGVRYLTLFAFSTENWQRPQDEVQALMKLFEQYLESELPVLLKNGIRLRAIGNLSKLSPGIQEALRANSEATQDNTGMDLILALSYGGREELIHASRLIAERVQRRELAPEDINEEIVRSHLYAPDVPDPDLLIRTSDEIRISNFLLWQLAYTEMVISSSLWPEFDKKELDRCIDEYSQRQRRFGLTEEQLKLA